MKILPSLISADLLQLGEVIRQLNPHVDGYHLDVMDYHFVPNLTWGPAFINAIRAATTLPLHIHLMMDNPRIILASLALQAEDCCFVHYEAVEKADLAQLAASLHERGLRAGLAINPATTVDDIASVIPLFDDVLIMSVQPGFSGQKFIDVFDKVAALSAYKKERGLTFAMHMDGGINTDILKQVCHYPIDSVGVAQAIFHNAALIDNLRMLRCASKK